LEDLRRDGLTIVVISHDFSGLDGVCTRTLRLRDGKLCPDRTAAGGVA
jgi:energy-coupling factor transport system ATP-binding protein